MAAPYNRNDRYSGPPRGRGHRGGRGRGGYDGGRGHRGGPRRGRGGYGGPPPPPRGGGFGHGGDRGGRGGYGGGRGRGGGGGYGGGNQGGGRYGGHNNNQGSSRMQQHSNNNRQQDEEVFGVFVGDLPPEATEEDLEEYFKQIGAVKKCKVIRNAETSLSKRYGFVHFSSEELREEAIKKLHGTVFKGQMINVRTQHYKETHRCLVKPGTRPTDIYIGNIPKNLNRVQLQHEVENWGIPKVKEVRIFKNESGAYCFISFETEAEVLTAMNILKDEYTAGQRLLAGRALLIQGQAGSITQALNAELLRNPNLAQNAEEHQIAQSLEMMKQVLGGESCPLDDRQLALLEKSQRTLYVRNLHPNTTESALHEKFSRYGELRKVIIVSDKDTKVPMGYGFVEFMSSQACSQAALTDDSQLDGQLLTLQVSRPPKEIHAIITAAGIHGLTDANGNLLTQFSQQVPAQQCYFQDPKSGQLFIGDAQHAAHYVSQGYVQVQPQFESAPQAPAQTQVAAPQQAQAQAGYQQPQYQQQYQQQQYVQQQAPQQQAPQQQNYQQPAPEQHRGGPPREGRRGGHPSGKSDRAAPYHSQQQPRSGRSQRFSPY